MKLQMKFAVGHNHEFEVGTLKREKWYGFHLFGKNKILTVKLVNRKKVVIMIRDGKPENDESKWGEPIQKIELDFKY